MFTGIIQTLGEVKEMTHVGGDIRARIKTHFPQPESINLGDSIAMDGVCLTVTEIESDEVTVDISVETVNKTNVAHWQVGSVLNLEPAMTLQDQLGGHLVSGHVDDLGTLLGREDSGRSEIFTFKIPSDLMRFVVIKGSVTINGVSLTVNTVETDTISVNLVPHTMSHTNLGQLAVNDAVNIEVDTIARYVDKMLQPHLPSTP